MLGQVTKRERFIANLQHQRPQNGDQIQSHRGPTTIARNELYTIIMQDDGRIAERNDLSLNVPVDQEFLYPMPSCYVSRRTSDNTVVSGNRNSATNQSQITEPLNESARGSVQRRQPSMPLAQNQWAHQFEVSVSKKLVAPETTN